MKYAKPNEAIEGLRFHCRNDSPTSQGLALLKWIDSLPAEFEIVEPGMTQVKWPEECTKDAMNRAARYLSYNAGNTEGAAKHMLFVLAAIAPEEKKKRRV